MLIHQEIEAIIEQFLKVDYQDFNLDTLSQIASSLNWELKFSPGGGCIIYCKFASTGRYWAFGYSQSEDCYKLEWFLITLYLWENYDQEDFETREAYQLERQQYDDYYLLAKQQLITILGDPVFSTTRTPKEFSLFDFSLSGMVSHIKQKIFLRTTPKDYKQVAWLLTNGIMYLYQGERDIQFGIEVGLFFESWDHKNQIQELKFEP